MTSLNRQSAILTRHTFISVASLVLLLSCGSRVDVGSYIGTQRCCGSGGDFYFQLTVNTINGDSVSGTVTSLIGDSVPFSGNKDGDVLEFDIHHEVFASSWHYVATFTEKGVVGRYQAQDLRDADGTFEALRQ